MSGWHNNMSAVVVRGRARDVTHAHNSMPTTPTAKECTGAVDLPSITNVKGCW